MKKIIFSGKLYAILSVLFFISSYSCTSEYVFPKEAKNNENTRILPRTPDCNIDVSQQVKVKVSERDHILLSEILTCYFYGTTTEGYCEYRLTTQYDGPKVYIVTSIIGDDVEGL